VFRAEKPTLQSQKPFLLPVMFTYITRQNWMGDHFFLHFLYSFLILSPSFFRRHSFSISPPSSSSFISVLPYLYQFCTFISFRLLATIPSLSISMFVLQIFLALILQRQETGWICTRILVKNKKGKAIPVTGRVGP
jgi:hypothetical protein